jgi:uncharacterized membrane protein YfcA
MILSISFFIIAIIYSMVGFGGGSSYLAILSLTEISHSQIVVLALISNIIVVSNGSYNFFKRGHLNLKLIAPLCLTSVPLAYIGGTIKLNQLEFQYLLAGSLILSSFFLFINSKTQLNHEEKIIIPSNLFLTSLGGFLGLLSGMVGIGGGIFLMPILVYKSAANVKEISLASSFFILLNSLSGLFGQLIKTSDPFILFSDLFTNHWMLFFSVFIGGQIGSRLGSHHIFQNNWVKILTSILILYAGLRILL